MNTAAVRDFGRRAWHRARRRLGWPGLAGVAMLVLALAVLAALPALQHSIEQARRVVDQRRAARPACAAASAPAGERDTLRDFAAAFPPTSQSQDDLAAVFASAERARITLAKGDYAVQDEAGSPFVSYVVSFPVHEPYASIKDFTAAVLEALPHAALDEMRMSRPDSEGVVLDATLRFTLVDRRAGAGS